jgi:nucleotide-binding universal stress UspA family protein
MILVAVDGSAAADAALTLALNLARRNGELLIVHAIDVVAVASESVTPYGGDPTTMLNVLEQDEREILAEALARAQKAAVPATTISLQGGIAEQIVAIANERRVEAIVMGTHGRRGIDRFVSGSVAESVVRTAPVPVFVINETFAKGTAGGPFRRIFVAADGSEPASAAAHVAIALAAADGAQVVFCNVLAEKENSPVAFDVAQKLAKDQGVDSGTLLVHGRDPAEVLIASAESSHADLIAIGTHGRGGFNRLVLGSVADGVIRNSPIPVLVVRGAEVVNRRAAAPSFSS